MRAIRINHVSVSADDVEASARFYEHVFGMERIASYAFAFPTRYLRIGDQQLHLFQRDTSAPAYHHLAFDVDDFVEAYERVEALGIIESAAFYSPIYELPDGSLQLYVRDPGGNLVEIDWPDARLVDRSRLPEIRKLDDDVPQVGEALRATLYLDGIPEWAKAKGADADVALRPVALDGGASLSSTVAGSEDVA